MDEKFIKFYSLPNTVCSCRDEAGFFTPLSLRYKEFYDYLKEDIKSSEVLDKMEIFRTCCRMKFLSMPILPMIDRTSERYYDDTKNETVTRRTDDIIPDYPPPEFPLLPLN